MDSIELHDTSEQEMLHHLYNKVTGWPADLIIGECDLFGEKEPWQIWDQEFSNDGQQEDLLVFTKSKKKTAGGSRLDRRIGTGTWRADDTGFFIYSNDEINGMTLTGMRQKFHYEGRSSSVEDGRWIMYEYNLHNSISVHADWTFLIITRVENSMKNFCPVCYEYLLDSIKATKILKCGHTMHMDCFNDMKKQNMYRCPICSKTMRDMSVFWKLLDEEIEATVMPEEYRYEVSILCNDCNNTGKACFHILGHKCHHCNSYNTRRLSAPDN